MSRTRWIAIAAKAIPPTLFTIASVALALLNPELSGTEELNIVDICGQVSAGLLAIAFISSIVFGVRHKREIAKCDLPPVVAPPTELGSQVF
jgi:hypothetical protein